MKTNTKKKWGNAIIIISCIMTIITFCAFTIGLFVDNEPTATLGAFDYAIGDLNSDGEPIESHKSIYTKNFIKLENLQKLELKEDASCTFEIHLYDEEKEYVEQEETTDLDTLIDKYDEDRYIRIVIVPNNIDGERPDIGIFDVAKYANMLNVTYKK